ncbi:MAG: hypothetical protein AAF830_01460 [Pseudomonadota bacterium]
MLLLKTFFARTALVLLCLATLASEAALGQSLSPMRAEVVTFGDVGAVRTSLRNPYTTARRFDIEVFDLDWNKVDDARLTRKTLSLAPGATTSILALLPVTDENPRSVYVCASSRSYRPTSAGLRGQVCGRYQVIKRQL